MHIRSVHAQGFKRFDNLSLIELPVTARLVVLLGPNGGGKSSLFDAFNVWFQRNRGQGYANDQEYYSKSQFITPGQEPIDGVVDIQFFENVSDHRRSFSIRSAHRNVPDFVQTGMPYSQSLTDRPIVARLIDNDESVAQNYVALLSQTIDNLSNDELQSISVRDFNVRLYGDIQNSLLAVFGDLDLIGFDRPLQNGTFRFNKGKSRRFPYKNLSAGERSAFDILLDILVKRDQYSQAIYCVDEPELHLNSRTQGKLLSEMIRLLPATSQLWIATHSVGMMRAAKELATAHPARGGFFGLL